MLLKQQLLLFLILGYVLFLKPVLLLQKPADDSAAIDALSGDFDSCGKPAVPQQLPTKVKIISC